jgi:hypothetical protein
MNKGRVERPDGGGSGIDFILQRLHHPVWLLSHPKYVRKLTYFIFDWSKFGVVLWTSDDAELAGTITARHGLVHIRQVISRQVVPNKNVMVVHPLDPKLLNLGANVITEITKNVGCCPTAVYTPNPTLRTLHSSKDVQGEPRIPRLNRKHNRDLGTKMVVPIFTHPKNPQCPSPRVVALLHCNTKLIDVNELASRHLKNSERGGAVNEAPDTELDIRPLSLLGFSGSPLLCYLQLSKVLRESLLRVQQPSLVVEEDSHLVKGGFRPGPQEGHKIDHVDPHDLLSGLISHLAMRMKTLTPAAKGRLGDIDILAGLRPCNLLLAKPYVVSPTATTGRMRHHATCLLKLLG